MSVSPSTDTAGPEPDQATDPAPGMTAGAAVEPELEPVGSPNDPERIRGEALRRSLHFCTLGWVFGAFWFAAAVSGGVPTRLVESLVTPETKDGIFGLMGAIPSIGMLFMVPGSWHIQRAGRRKGIFLWWLTIMRVMYLPVALLPWIVPAKHKGSAYLLVVFLFIAWAAGQYGGQAWNSWMADLVPKRVRGKYFARRSRWGILVMACTAIGLGLLLDYTETARFQTLMAPVQDATGLPPRMAVISVVLFLAAIAGIIDIQTFHKVEEPPMRAKPARDPMGMFMAPLKNGRFMRFVGYLTCVACADAILGAFVWVYVLDMLDGMAKRTRAAGESSFLADHGVLAAYVVLQISVNVGSLLGLPVWGRVVDRLGRKPVIFWGSFLHTLTLVFWVVASPGILLYGLVVQLIAGAVVCGRDTANFNMMLGFLRSGGPAYLTVASVCTAVAGATSAFLVGQLAGTMHGKTWTVLAGTGWEHTFGHYNVLFAVTVLLRLLADFVLLPYVHDGPRVSRRVALKHIISDAYGSLRTVVVAPLRDFDLAAIPVLGPLARQRLK